jgi:protocatechuate 3,4-dioxygenase beta subunit
LNPGDELAAYRIGGTAGERLQFHSVSTSTTNGSWFLEGENNQEVAGAALGSDFTANLTATGPYYLELIGTTTAAISYSFQVSDLTTYPPIASSGFNTPQSGTLAGSTSKSFTFQAPAGLPIDFNNLGFGGSISATLTDPSNNTVFSYNPGSSSNAGPYVLTASGTYTLKLANSSSSSQNYDFNMLSLPGAATSLALGPTQTVTGTLNPGLTTAVYSFLGTAQERIFLDNQTASGVAVNFVLIKPDGGQMFNINYNDSGPLSLPESGTYYLLAVGSSSSTLNYGFRLTDTACVPLTFGATTSGTVTTATQSDVYSFTGTAGERTYFEELSDSNGYYTAYWYLYGPNNQSITSNWIGGDLTATLPTNGTYTLVVDNNTSYSTATYSFEAIQNVDPTTSINLGQTVSGTIADPGDEATYTFTISPAQIAAGQRIFVNGLDPSISYLDAILTDPNGNTIYNSNAASNEGPYTLTYAGTYTLTVYSNGTNRATGKYSFVVDDVTAPASSIALTSGAGTTVSGTLATGATDNFYQLSGTAGERLYFEGVSDSPSYSAQYYLYNAANGNILNNWVESNGTVTLPYTGTYLLGVVGWYASNPSDSYEFEVFNNVDPTTPLALNSEVTGSLANPGDEATYTFTGSIGQQIQFNGLEASSNQVATLYDPEGSTVFSSYLQNNAGPYTLTTPGTYSLVLTTNGGSHTGNFDFRLLDLQSETKLQVNTTEADLTVTLSSPATEQVLVQYATADGTATVAGGAYKPATGLLLFQPGQTTATVEVQALDQFTTGSTYFDVNLSNPVGAGATIASGGGTGVVTINASGQGTLNGEVFNDLNGSGTLNGVDPGLAGWTVDLLNSSQTVISTATTDANGNYSFTGLAAGSYTVAEVPQSGYVQTAPTAPGTYAVTLATGQTINDLNFGDFQTVTLSGMVYNDLGGSGTFASGDPGLSGWTVDLLNSSNQVVQTDTTDSHGNYTFPGVGPGSYTVQEVLQSGYVQTSSPASYSERIAGEQDVGGLSFGIFQLATFSGEVFNDLGGSGTFVSGDPGLAGWTVELLNSSNTVVATAATNSSGDYSFTGVGPGSYTIQEVQQSGYIPTTPASIAVTATSGLVSTTNNFGQFQALTLTGEVYNDFNGSGTLVSGDPGLSGWTVDLLNGSNQVIATSTTDSNGDYTFHVNSAGTYTVQEVLQSGYLLTAPSSGSYTVAVSSGQSAGNLNFGNFQTVTFRGEVYNDFNGNGTLDSGEPGLAGWTVDLLNGSNQTIATATTGSNGAYSFPGIGPGAYTIEVVSQTGYVQSSTPATYHETAASGQSVANLNFGEFQTVTLSGEVYDDANGDGVLDNGESGLSGWTVDLLNSSNQVAATATTDSNGDYSFPGVGPGSYTIQAVVQSGYVSTDAPYHLTTSSGLNVGGFNLGEALPATLSGDVFVDVSGSGTLVSGDPGLAGWTVEAVNRSNQVAATATTNAQGDYALTGVAPGPFTIQEVLKSGYVQTTSPSTYSLTISQGQTVANLNFGNFQTVTFSGEVYNDLNGSGTLVSGDPGLAGWTVKLLGSSNQVIATATTDSNGDYSFPGVGPGTYTIQEVVQSGYVQTSSPADYSVTTSSGQNVANLNFGNQQAESLSGEVYNDLNGNGSLDSGEPGLAGWTVNLLNSSSQVVATTTTDSHGDYAFTITSPGTYKVQEILQSGYALTAPASGTYTKTLASGQSISGLDFGDFQSVTLSGEVYSDLNDNGVLNSGEPGLPGWTVNLLNSSSQVVGTATTDSGGDYSFTITNPGTYTIEEVLQSGYVLTAPASGSYTETLTSGESVSGLQFGNFALVSPTATVINPTSSSVGYGQSVTFTATVSSSNGTPPDGTVQFLVNGSNYGSPVSLSGATAQRAIAEPAGTYTITAEYTGDTHYGATLPGAETGATLTVTPAVTATVVTPETASISSGLSVTFTATVSSTDGTPPSGSVQFLVNGSNYGSPVSLSGSTAQLAITEPLGTYTIAAEYTGTANYAATLTAAETTAALTVNPATLVSIAVTPANPSISKGLTQQIHGHGYLH